LHAPDQQVLFPGSDIGRLSDQQQQGTVLHLPQHDFGSAGQIGSTTGHLQQQQSGRSASQQGYGQMSQLFSQAEMLEDDLKAYAALVHEQKADSRYAQSWQLLCMPNHCKAKQLLRSTPATSATSALQTSWTSVNFSTGHVA